MPLFSGLDVIAAIRNQNPEAAIVLATACSEEEKIVKDGIALGVNGILKKPFMSQDNLIESIHSLIDRSFKRIGI